MFRVKLYRLPSSHAIKIYYMLIVHLEKYYQKSALLESSGLIRLKIFVWLLNLRANGTYHVGYPDDRNNSTIRFSHYLGIDPTDWGSNPPAQPQTTVQQQATSHQAHHLQQQEATQTSETISTVSIRRACKIIIDCLKMERDWSIMQFVLKELPNILQNKAILKGNDMDGLATTIISLVSMIDIRQIFYF